MKKKSGNISILVIFILLASSLLGILSMNFVQQMMKQSAIVHSYYKAYYLSKAGIELGLSAIGTRDVGFEYSLSTGDDFMSGNFSCGSHCTLSLSISGTASLLSQKFGLGSGCEHPYQLSGGQSLIVPLFRDITSGSLDRFFETGIVYENLAYVFKAGDKITFIPPTDGDIVAGDATYSILILSGEELAENGMFSQKGSLTSNGLSTFRDGFEAYLTGIDSTLYFMASRRKDEYANPWFVQNGFRMYLLISNNSDQEERFCIKVGSDAQSLTNQTDMLPTDTFLFQSQGTYANETVALDASYIQPIPSFLFGTY